ncbi:hypothetical protein BCR34DRAFT_597681 [Clohesyomyces aquaticus]|uniref:Glycosyl transferase family 25 domain-containing protein n=1 Tax=Clohesyomyces aquaticus TaxID=1231657 RepID=A0A1Y2A1I3_9PLEO|nr:hypothetical protein BCR34DRAFT_597681 [Clohesyomyces aquaticus]
MAVLTAQAIRMIQIGGACSIVLFLFYSLSHFKSGSFGDSFSSNVNIPGAPVMSFKNVPKPKPANSTLDFQEILYISMPWRTDRQDALSLLAAISGIKMKLIPGINPSDMHVKGEPHMLNGQNMTGSPALGCWRAHANAWKYMIDNDIESALILEDDIDWDVNIKEIFGLWQWQLKYNNTIRWGRENVKKGWKEDCPYGCDWDELWMGQCNNKVNKNRLDLHWTYEDPNGPDLDSLHDWSKKEMTQVWNVTSDNRSGNQMRVTSATYGPLCTMGYAVSRMGAMRMLYNIGGWKGLGSPVDLEIQYKTNDGLLSGYTMTPPAFTVWRLGGNKDSDNDPNIEKNNNAGTGNENGESKGIKHSVRKHLSEVLEKNYWRDMENEIR